jgi:hypothetical protein
MAEKFLPKKFKSDKDYRAAMVEATRLAVQTGTVFDAAYMETMTSCDQVCLVGFMLLSTSLNSAWLPFVP